MISVTFFGPNSEHSNELKIMRYWFIFAEKSHFEKFNFSRFSQKYPFSKTSFSNRLKDFKKILLAYCRPASDAGLYLAVFSETLSSLRFDALKNRFFHPRKRYVYCGMAISSIVILNPIILITLFSSNSELSMSYRSSVLDLGSLRN